MTTFLDINKISDVNWLEIRKAANGSLRSYLHDSYDAYIIWDNNRQANMIVFPSYDLYIGFILTWM